MNPLNRILAAIAVLALAVAPGAALAAKSKSKSKKPTPRAKVFRAILEPTTTDAQYAGIRGRSHFVDGKKNDNITIHVRNLRPGATYLWHMHEANGDTNPCDAGSAGPIVTAFNWKPKKANAAGNLNAKAKTKGFVREPGETYYVNLHAEDGTVLACGVLKAKAKPKAKKKGASKKKGSSQKQRGSTNRGSRGKQRP